MADILQEMAVDATLTEEEQEEADKLKAEERLRKEQMLESLANSITAKFTTRAAKRSGKENQWLRSAALYYGKLAVGDYYIKPESPFEIGKYKSRPDVNIVRSKCSIAVAQTFSMQFGTSNKNWDIGPSKNDKSPDATARCKAMSDTIEAQLEDTRYSMHCRRAMWDRVNLGTGIIKGPISTGKLVRSYRKIEGSSVWEPDITVDYAPTLTRVNPWFFYPDETTEDPSKIEDTIETHPMSALELKKYMKHDGFYADAIEKVLEKKPEEYNSTNWTEFALLSENNPNLYKDKYLVLEYHGPITRTQLDELSIEVCYDSINDEYYGEVWVCQGEVIRVELEAVEASFRVPYYVSIWEKDPGSVFGFGVPLMMEDSQRVVNEAWHMILDNSSISSGPQVAMQKHLIEPANGKWELGPKQIWYLTDPQATVDQAIQFFNVPNVTAQIIPILQMAQGFGEEESCIPLITAGLTSPQAQDTATGQLVVQHASTTLLDFTSEEWDDNITTHVIEAWYGWNMQYNPDDSIKGVYNVDVRTSTEYKNKQLHIRDLEKLSVEAAQNPALAKWVNQDALTKARLSMMNIPTHEIVKSDEQVAVEEEAAKNAPPPPEIMKLQLDARRMDIDEAELAFEMQQQQQREQWEHEEKMTANQARLVESEARVAVSQNEKETEILKLAQRSEETAAKLISQEKIARENNLTKAFQVGLAETRKQQEADTYQEEVDLAKQTGSGV